ncbi:MAG: NUDIX hydrolase [Actinomycetota bacterium]|nr:NUDIX hydrolase [Actinomycetota bacterium]
MKDNRSRTSLVGGSSYRDSSGRTLEDYPRPSVAVDTALLTVLSDEYKAAVLAVLQVRRVNDRGWGLPGTFLHPGERLRDAVDRSLRLKAGVTGLQPRQLRVFDEPDRDDRGWVLSVAHIDSVPLARLQARLPGETRLTPVGRPGRLPYGHGDIIRLAVDDLRTRYAVAPDPGALLPATFTLRDLRLVHEAVAGGPLQRDTFRRAMEDLVVATGELSSGTRGRPAELFARI